MAKRDFFYAVTILVFVCFEARGNTLSVGVEKVFPKLNFTNPTVLIQEPGNDRKWYVAEKSGKIFVFRNLASVAEKKLFVDISDRVDHSFEGGLLGVAFHPQFQNTQTIFLSYTSSQFPEKDNSRTLVSRISRFKVTGNKIDPGSEKIIFTLDQPWNNHNGGHIAFGPDGLLYAGFGDGGSWGDPNDNGQNTATILGSLIRIDVSGKTSYSIPSDNPFAKNKACSRTKACPEIYAWGLRNPWRWSFDRKTGQLWLGDVGQNKKEEINLIQKGKNYGWRCYEGNSPYNLKNCNQSNYEAPVLDYERFTAPKSRHGHVASVTGGYVYRGKQLKKAGGVYFYADFVVGKLYALKNPYTPQRKKLKIADTKKFIVSFAQDKAGELYFLDYREDGQIYKLVHLAK